MPDLEALLRQLDLTQKVRLLTGQDWWSLPAEPAIGLRSLVVSDGPAGVRGRTWSELSPSASFPSPTALAASWDVDRVAEVAGLLAGEARRKGVDVVLAPTVNLHRSPLGGRHFEAFSEDPLLSGRIGVAYVRGLQAAGVGATAKHYVANESETNRFTVDIQVDERTLRELYLLPFELMVTEGGAWLVMAAYNGVNGATMTENPLLTHPLKDEWGFDGVVVSDWFATRTAVPAGAAALDLVMPGPWSPWVEGLVDAVRDNKVPESAVDDKVLRLLRLAARVGALEGVEPAVAPQPAVSEARLRAGLRDASAAGMVLLRNKGLLPMSPEGLGRVAVIGQLAAEARIQGGGSATVVPEHVVSPLAGLRAELGDSVDHEIGVRLSEGLGPVPIELVTAADGEHGLDVRWLAADGSELRHERRRGARHFWLGDVLPNAAEVRVSGRFRADTAGEWRFGVVGNGTVELDLAGETVIATTLAPAGDIVEDTLRAKPEASVTRLLAEGDEFDIVLRHTVEPGAVVFDHTLGVDRPHRTPEAEFAAAVDLAEGADLAIVVVGTTERVESEGFDRSSLALPDGQDDLVRAVLAVNPRTVVVVNSGGPVLLPWWEDAGALLLTWFGGQELGSALAAVLLGELEPGGRLPTTWPAAEADVPVLSTTPTDGVLRYTEGVHVGYRAWLRADVAPVFPFGFGLGYTTWEYLELTTVDGSGFTVRVRNSGPRAGKEVVQLYASLESSEVDRPVRWLIGFAVVTAAAGAEAIATVTVAPRAWQHWSEQDGGWRTEPGEYTVFAGRSVEDLPLRTKIQKR
jgi:beta-glucosidase